MWQYKQTDELYHHGIPGMKWGVRRYQNKDGSLKPLGRKRAMKRMESSMKTKGEPNKKHLFKSNKKQKGSPKQKNNDQNKKQVRDIRTVPTDELKRMTDRMNTEVNFIRSKEQLMALQPKPKEPLGKRFIKSVGNDLILPAAKEAGKQILADWLKKQGKELAGLNQQNLSPYEKLKREAEISKLRRQLYDNNMYLEKRKK